MVHVPMVLLTAHTEEETQARGGAEDVVAFVTKPFDPEALVALVRNALAAGGTA